MDKALNHPSSFKILKLSVLLVFIGRAYQHLFWDAPFRAFFWDESLLKPSVEKFLNMKWNQYVTSLNINSYIDFSVISFGVLYLISALVIWRFNLRNRFHKLFVILGGTGLVILAYLLMKENFYRYSQFFEYSLQFSIPFLLVFYSKEFIKKHLETILKILITIVFVSHGLFAVGYYPVPGHFLGMAIDILGLSDKGATTFLTIAGIMDLLIGILIFIPKISKYVLIYAFIWGTLTAFARLFYGFYFNFFWESIHATVYEVIYRLPHGLIPLMLLVLTSEKKIGSKMRNQ